MSLIQTNEEEYEEPFSDKKWETLEKQSEINKKRKEKKSQRVLENCEHCYSNNQIWFEQIILNKSEILLLVPKFFRYNGFYEFRIMPMEHFSSSLQLDEQVNLL